jgi:FAD/FMN-containing dehydrogenase
LRQGGTSPTRRERYSNRERAFGGEGRPRYAPLESLSVDPLDRRELLVRTGGIALAAGALAGLPALAAAGSAADDPRLRELERELDGDVVTPSDPKYARARLAENTRFDAVKPLAIAFPESVADVQKAVRWARKYDVRLAARSGGHSYGGYSTTRGLVLDLSRLAAVQPAANGTARIGGGALLIDVYDRLASAGRILPGGSCSTVGIGGLALGGGVGFASRKHGTTSDNVVGLRIVTADGRALTCSPSENADLYWACRGGGGGNFGVVADFTFRTYPVSGVTTFSIAWPWANARAVVQEWQRWAPDTPDGLFSVLNLHVARGAPPGIAAAGQFFGSESELRTLLRPLVGTGAPTLVSVVARSYMEAVFHWAACGSVAACHPAGTPGGRVPRATFKAKSRYALGPISAAGVDAIVRALEGGSSVPGLVGGGVLLDSYGGAINRVPAAATAFVHRTARFSLQFSAYWAPGTRSAPSLDWLDRFYRAAVPFLSAFAYQNYIDPDLATWKHAYYGANLARLVQVKRRFDPTNVFRFAQSIPLTM